VAQETLIAFHKQEAFSLGQKLTTKSNICFLQIFQVKLDFVVIKLIPEKLLQNAVFKTIHPTTTTTISTTTILTSTLTTATIAGLAITTQGRTPTQITTEDQIVAAHNQKQMLGFVSIEVN